MTDQEFLSQGQPCDKYMTKVGFLMLACATYPHRAIEYAEKIGNDPAEQKELQESCKLFIEHVNKFKPSGAVPAMKDLAYAGKALSHRFGNQFYRAMGMYLNMMISLMEDGSPHRGPATSDKPSQ